MCGKQVTQKKQQKKTAGFPGNKTEQENEKIK